MVGGGVGYRFNNFIRADVTFQKRRFKAKSMFIKKMNQDVVFVNAYCSLINEGYLIPYFNQELAKLTTMWRNFIIPLPLGAYLLT